MKPLVKIKSIRLEKFNNSEFANFAKRFVKIIYQVHEGDTPATGKELGIDGEDLTQFEAELAKMKDLVTQSRISDHTKELAELDKKRNAYLRYLFSTVRSAKLSLEAEQCKAATSLYNVMTPYVGCQRLPNQQKTRSIEGLVTDLSKPENTANMRKLSLNNTLDDLGTTNDAYEELTDERTDKQSAARIEESKAVRARMIVLYDYMSTIAFVESVHTPTEATANFVRLLNALIDETTALHNQRMGQLNRKAKKKE